MLDHHDKRAILLMVLQVLENYSDEKHPLPMEGERSLQSYILRDYDLEKAPSRNTLSRNLKILWDGFGYDLHRVPGKGVYLQKRTLTRSQRQLLEDMVREARFLSPREQEGILENLDALFRKKTYWGISQVSERFTGVNLRNRDFSGTWMCWRKRSRRYARSGSPTTRCGRTELSSRFLLAPGSRGAGWSILLTWCTPTASIT